MMVKPFRKNVVITGVSSGIGEAIAQHLIEDGYRVFGSVRKTEDAERLQSSLGSQFTPLLFDVCDSAAIEQSVKNVSESLEGIPLAGLVNNAGLAAFGPLECLDDETFEQVIAVNLLGVRLVTNAFLPLLKSGDSEQEQQINAGKIINISSLSGIVNTPMNGAYCVSKHALESLSEIYRRELKADKIKVFSIRSGPIQSQIWSKNKQNDDAKYANPHYQKMSEKSQAIMADAAKDALPASVIAHVVNDILSDRKRKLTYELGGGAFFAKLMSVKFPARWADWLIHRALTK